MAITSDLQQLSEDELDLVRSWVGVASFERGLDADERALARKLGMIVSDDGWTVRWPKDD